MFEYQLLTLQVPENMGFYNVRPPSYKLVYKPQ